MTAIPTADGPEAVPAPASERPLSTENVAKALSTPPESTLAQLGRYTIVGGIAFACDFSTLWLCTELLKTHYLISGALGLLVGIAVNYALSIRFVFRVRRLQRNSAMELLIFGLIGLLGLGINEGLLYALTDQLGLDYRISKIGATAITYLWNFFARKRSLFTA